MGHGVPGVDLERSEHPFLAPGPQLDTASPRLVRELVGVGDEETAAVGGEPRRLDKGSREPQRRAYVPGTVGDRDSGNIVIAAGDDQELAVRAPRGIAHPAPD